MSVAVVIVTYNNAKDIGPCLRSVSSDAAVSQVVVVDNASSDETLRVVQAHEPRVCLVASPTNLGFATACNLAARQVGSAGWLLFLNPDTVLHPNAITRLVEAAQAEGVALASGKLVGNDGSPQIGYITRRIPTPGFLLAETLLVNRVWPGNPLNRHHLCMDLDYSRRQSIEQPAGALLLISHAVFRRLGGFDERFYLWFEDADLCKRARDEGFSIVYEPSAVVTHLGGGSSQSQNVTFNQPNWYASMMTYSREHFSRSAALTVRAGIVLGCIIRGAIVTLVRYPPDRWTAASTFLRTAWRAAVGSLPGPMAPRARVKNH